ncbi:MAG: hypothetical protein JWN40_2587 [Phycisphaerales bacterium]|nr:hypothetical protein [Phycisphaerales bacterium]
MTIVIRCLVLALFASNALGALPLASQDPLKVRLDPAGPYLILASEKAERDYAKAIVAAKQLHPAAATATFAPADDLAAAKKILLAKQPRYVLLFLKPEELDVNFAWQWLTLSTQLNDDPLVDVRTGIITGASPADAASFVERIAAAVNGRTTLPARFIDNLGPNPQAGKGDFIQQTGTFMIPALQPRLGLGLISHGAEAFTDAHLDSMRGAGLIHFGGHGYPDRIADGLRGTQAKSLRLSPCVAFNGACYTGVTHRWYDQFTPDGKVVEKTVPAADCFCLNFLRTDAIAYLAALHPDHGIPVYQEMEFLAYSGASLGDVIKQTYDGIILASGGRVPRFVRFKDGMPAPAWSASDMMLKGTASRVLFGDPSLIVGDAFTNPPFKVDVKADGESLRVTATLTNAALKSSFTDTYRSDLSRDQNLFNDRAMFIADLPRGWDAVHGVEVVEVSAGGQALKHRLVGWAVEAQGDERRLHVQVDVPSDGYMQSALRVTGATVVVKVIR